MADWLLFASLFVNVAVAGFMGVALNFGLKRMLPGMEVVFGPDSPARRILACVYLAIAAASVVALGFAELRRPIAAILLPLQIGYKLLTLVFVTDRSNPVPWWNLAISVLHGGTLWAMWAGAE
jgi:hypothetical protein